MFSARKASGGAVLLAGMILTGVAMTRADAPRAVEQDVKVYSQNKQFYAVSHKKEQRTEVFRAGTAKKLEWEIPGYSPILFLADDGKHLVEGYAGGNILAADVKASDALLVFYVGTQRVATVTIGQMFPHPEKLPGTTSGRAWGNFWGFEGSDHFLLLLSDGHKVTFDTSSGKKIAG
jgi:hypothetical protein